MGDKRKPGRRPAATGLCGVSEAGPLEVGLEGTLRPPDPGWTVESAMPRLLSPPVWNDDIERSVLTWAESGDADVFRVMSWAVHSDHDRAETERFYRLTHAQAGPRSTNCVPGGASQESGCCVGDRES